MGRFRAGREDLASILRSSATNVSARCTEAVGFEKCTHGPAPGAAFDRQSIIYCNNKPARAA